jgi:uracil-DNA glycosylase
MNKTGRRKADKILFKNCMEFVSEEVSILNPDIIITQGLEAHYSLKNKFPKLENVANVFQNGLSEVSVIVINNHPVLWIRTYHPGSWGKFNKVTMESLPAYAKISHEFIKATN